MTAGRRTGILSLIAIILLIVGGSDVPASGCFEREYADPSDTSMEYYNDGPHVLWQNDTTAIVFYMCCGEIASETYAIKNEFQFTGFCRDTDIEYWITPTGYDPGPEVINGASKIMAISDIHGEYEAFEEFLMTAGVIDGDCNWAWGDGHLVIVGDVLDRGDMVTECLWLIHRLELEAKESGGGVHLLLGNHEVMDLQGDLRYVGAKYREGIVKKSRIEYNDIFGSVTELGRWIRSRNTAMKINEILFVHGGIAPYIVDSAFSIKEINEAVREYIDLPSSPLAFNDTAKLLLGSTGPFWYRGFFEAREGRYPMAASEDIDKTLDYFGVTTLVVGHTEIDSVTALYGGRVIAVDISLEDLGTYEAMLWQDGRFYRIKGKGDLVPLK